MNVLLLGPLHPFWSAFADPDLPPTSNCPFLVMLMMILTGKIVEQKVIQSISMSFSLYHHHPIIMVWGAFEALDSCFAIWTPLTYSSLHCDDLHLYKFEALPDILK